ncbi:MAG: hypothetical protein ABIP03_02595 [Aquihabitans sp.]
MSRIEQLGAWPARVLWVALALVPGGTLDDALSGRSTPVRLVVLVGLATVWTVGLVGLLVPRTASLTAVRVIVPGGLAAAAATTATGHAVDGADLVALTVAALSVAAVLAPWFTEAWVDGSSYGPEQRLPLQTPTVFALIVVPLTWTAVIAGLSVGPLLLAARQWVPGTLAVVVGAPLAAAGIRSMHQLSRRWVVLVPAGLVLHDPLTMPEAQLFPRKSIARLGAADADTDADDYTAGASGLALQLDLIEPIDLLVRGRGRSTETHMSEHLLFTPARPARLIDGARRNRIPV